MVSYLEALAHFHPTVKLTSFGNGTTYSALLPASESIIPSQELLDTQRLTLSQDIAWRNIQIERERRKFGGVQIGAKWYHSDDTSRIQQLGLVMMGANLPPIQWKTMDGSFIVMTPSLAMQIFQGTASKDIQVFTAAETHRAQMMVSPSPLSYDFKSGWPTIFGE